MTGTMERALEAPVLTEPLVLVSCDSHAGPRLEEDLRKYCPEKYLDAFDAYSRDTKAEMAKMMENGISDFLGDIANDASGMAYATKFARCMITAGHYDMETRLRDMDRDGVACEVVFHGSVNGQPLPFVPGGEDNFFSPTSGDLELIGLGLHIYNLWLADACSIEPERHVGLIHLPMWDIDAAIKELEWGASVGLTGINFPAPKEGVKRYDSPDWEPFWSACEAHNMTLNTHAGTGLTPDTSVPHWAIMLELEVGGWPSRRALAPMIFSGVFERHPGLKLVLTEQNGDWWTNTMREYDSSHKTHYWQIKEHAPKPPSEYCRSNVFIGASFMAPFEAKAAEDGDFAENIIWGTDYPHPEGTYQYQDDENSPNMTRMSLRHAFSAIKPENTKLMVGDNGIRVYGLDGDKLAAVAQRISAPTLEEVAEPVDTIPDEGGVLAFRTLGPFG